MPPQKPVYNNATVGIGKVAREVGLGVGTVHRIKREMASV
jgi:hypothetical protein